MRNGGTGPRADVALVMTSGGGSLDLYARQLSRHLSVPTVRASQTPHRRFGVPSFSRAAADALAADVRFAQRLRALGAPLHLPNQHLGRYARALAAPYVITVHDLMRLFDARGGARLIHRPNARDRLYLRADFAAVRRAAAVIAVSERTRADLVDHVGVDEDLVHVVANGVDHRVFRPRADASSEFPYLLFVGSEHPRKNLVGLLRALAGVVRVRRWRHLRLVKVGAPGGGEAPFREATSRAADALGLADRVVFRGRVDDDELARLYSGAAALVLPSRYEGFGLPPLEAMACGCPVVASHAGALGEVVGDAAVRVDPCSSASIARGIVTALEPAAARELRRRGLDHAARFSWKRAAKETLEVYGRALA